MCGCLLWIDCITPVCFGDSIQLYFVRACLSRLVALDKSRCSNDTTKTVQQGLPANKSLRWSSRARCSPPGWSLHLAPYSWVCNCYILSIWSEGLNYFAPLFFLFNLSCTTNFRFWHVTIHIHHCLMFSCHIARVTPPSTVKHKSAAYYLGRPGRVSDEDIKSTGSFFLSGHRPVHLIRHDGPLLEAARAGWACQI